jgi:hypothetical protein
MRLVSCAVGFKNDNNETILFEKGEDKTVFFRSRNNTIRESYLSIIQVAIQLFFDIKNCYSRIADVGLIDAYKNINHHINLQIFC